MIGNANELLFTRQFIVFESPAQIAAPVRDDIDLLLENGNDLLLEDGNLDLLLEAGGAEQGQGTISGLGLTEQFVTGGRLSAMDVSYPFNFHGLSRRTN